MSRIVMFIGFLIFLVFVMLWFCIIAGSRADKYAQQLRKITKRFQQVEREYNTIKLHYLAQKEALEQNDNQVSSAKH